VSFTLFAQTNLVVMASLFCMRAVVCLRDFPDLELDNPFTGLLGEFRAQHFGARFLPLNP